MGRLSPDRQPLLLLAIADRRDAAVLPTVVKEAQTGSKELRTIGRRSAGDIGNVSCVPALLAAATESDAELSQAAKTALAKLPGKDVDADLSPDRLRRRANWRCSPIAGQRQIAGAVPAIVTSLQDADAGVRGAAVQAIGLSAGPGR